MQVDDKLISYLEDITFLTLSADEKKRLTGDLQNMIDYMGQLQTMPAELITENTPECIHSCNKANVFRHDEARPSFDRELILKNAPVKTNEMFIAPKTVE